MFNSASPKKNKKQTKLYFHLKTSFIKSFEQKLVSAVTICPPMERKL